MLGFLPVSRSNQFSKRAHGVNQVFDCFSMSTGPTRRCLYLLFMLKNRSVPAETVLPLPLLRERSRGANWLGKYSGL